MLKKVFTYAAALALTALALPTFAATTAPASHPLATTAATTAKATTGKAIGKITSVNATSSTLVVETKKGTDTFSLAGAKITSHGKSASVSDLKVGEKVEVSYTTQGTSMTATDVALLGHA